MAKKHGAKQQKKLAKQKARRQEKRAIISRRTSTDPTIRLQKADRLPVVRSLVGETLWEDGIGHLVIVRQESEGNLVYASFLVDVYCLGVKNAFWDAGSPGDLRELIERMEEAQPMRPIAPECLVKIVQGAVEYAQFLGFRPHHDFRHAGMLLAGIDPAGCTRKFSFGREGRPFYIQGPNETPEEARAIADHLRAMGGDFLIQAEGPDLAGLEDDRIGPLALEMDEPEED
jgi:hypothetical protein